MPAQSSPVMPVLTGSPVAGMAYLDRPSPAGYFIFPDLSVRHEGLYRLSFSLFEELKEAKDGDNEPLGSPKAKDKLLSSHPMAPRSHVHFRLEVKSQPFAVYSAKKFPGLSESTLLSRTVAEQGCRVRIRRDVRMRRRDKASDGYADFEEDPHAQYPRPPSEHYGTPHQESDRARSISNASVDAQTPYSNGRRPSVHDLGYFPHNYTQPTYPQQPYQQPPPPPAPVQSTSSYGSGSHLNFGGPSTPQYATPQMPIQSTMHQTPTSYMASNNGWPNSSSVHNRQTSMPQNYFQAQPQAQQSMQSYGVYNQSPTTYDNQGYRTQIPEPRRASASEYPGNFAQNMGMNGHVQNHSALQQTYQQQPYSSRTATPVNSNGHVPQQLPPLKTNNITPQTSVDPLKYEPKTETPYEIHSSAAQIPRHIEPSPTYQTDYTSFSAGAYSTSVIQHSSTMAPQSQKRAYDSVFDDSHLNQPMYNNQRPSIDDQGKDRTQIVTDDGHVEDLYDATAIKSKVLMYKRADGRTQTKKCPSPIVPNR